MKIFGVIITAILICGLAYYKNSLTLSASAVSGIMLILLYFFAGIGGMSVMIFAFILVSIVGIINKRLKKDKADEITKKTGARDVVQVLANGLVSCICAIIFRMTGNRAFLITCYAAFAESLADSAASEIGSLSKKSPIDIVRLKKVETGTSGGISILGCTAAAVCSLLMACYVSIVSGFYIKEFISVLLSAITGMLLDSVLGSTIQLKYRCKVCGKITEKTVHCDTETETVSGYKPFDNDTVNLIGNVFAAAMAYFIAL